MLPQLFAQGPAIQTQHGRRVALVLLAVFHDSAEQGFFYLMQHHVVEVATGFSIERGEEVGDGLSGAVSKRRWPGRLISGFFC